MSDAMTPDQIAALAAHLGVDHAALSQAVEAVTTPPQSVEEPTDPAERLVDRFGVTWALIDGAWCSRLGQAPGEGSFAELDRDFGPLQIFGS